MTSGKKWGLIALIPILVVFEFVFILTSNSLLLRITGSIAIFFSIYLTAMYLVVKKKKGNS